MTGNDLRPPLAAQLRHRLWLIDPGFTFSFATDGALDIRHTRTPHAVVTIRRHHWYVTRVICGDHPAGANPIADYPTSRLDELATDIAHCLGITTGAWRQAA